MLNTVIRIPHLCSEFLKAVKKQRFKETESQKKEHSDVYEYMKDKICQHGNTETKFVENILKYIDTSYPNNFKGPTANNYKTHDNSDLVHILKPRQKRRLGAEKSLTIDDIDSDLPPLTILSPLR